MALTTVINTAAAVPEATATIFAVAAPTSVVVSGLGTSTLGVSEFCTIYVETVSGYEPLQIHGKNPVKLEVLNNSVLLTGPGNYKVVKEVTVGIVTVGYTA